MSSSSPQSRSLRPRKPKLEENMEEEDYELTQPRSKPRSSSSEKRKPTTKPKEKTSAVKKVKRDVIDPECSFVGEPVPDEEAWSSWPHHYTLGLRSGEDDEEEHLVAKCHYREAKVDDCCYGIGDDVFVEINEAKEMFKNQHGSSFKFDYAREILKHYPKWSCIKANSPRNLGGDSTPEQMTTHFQPSDAANEVPSREGSRQRPPGRNASKTRRKSVVETQSGWEKMLEIAVNTQAIMEKQFNENMLINRSKLEIERTKQRNKHAIQLQAYNQMMLQHQLDVATMTKDLSNMTPESKAFWKNKKRETVANSYVTRVARNLDFTAGSSQGNNNDDNSDQTNDYILNWNDDWSSHQ